MKNKVLSAICLPFVCVWVILKLIWVGLTHVECPHCQSGINMQGETCPVCGGEGIIPPRTAKKIQRNQ